MSELYQKRFPMGIPAYPPPDLAAREARLRRWTFWLFGLAGLFLVVASAAAVVVVKYLGQIAEAALAKPAQPNAGANAMKPVAAAPAKEEAKTQDRISHRVVEGLATASKEELDTGTVTETKTQRDLFLQTTALLSVSHLYQTYLNIGLLADARENEVYGETEALAMLQQVTGTLGLVDGQLDKIQETKLEDGDRKDVGRVRALATALKALAESLKSYWNNPGKERASQYKKARAAAWEQIKPLLGNG
jgi:hypothetical protein